MKKFTRLVSVLLVLAILLSTLTGLSFAATKNTGTRHVLCTSLSSQAVSYYNKNNFTYEKYASYVGGNESCLQTVNSELFKELHDLMTDTMTDSISYNSLTSYWKDTDRESGTSNATLFYSDETSGSYNREHVWPKSRASFYKSDGGCDIHHLRPTNSSINSDRSNHTMGNVRQICNAYERSTYNNKTVLWYNGTYTGNGSKGLVEVNDNVKGDVARIFLYVYVRWEERNLFENDPNPKTASGDTGGNDGRKVIYDLETLLQWCEMDPVDTWEMSRNDACEDVQGNRNIFIDYPEFAWLLFDQDMPADMDTPSGMAKATAVSYNITAVANNADYGTVTLDGRTITAIPNNGYEIEGHTLTPSDAATVTRDGNTFKLSQIKADCTLTVNFKARVPATITYNVPEGTTANGVTKAYIGDSVRLATVSGSPVNAPEDCTFFGWSTAEVEHTSKKPTVSAAGSTFKLSVPENVFYAVFTYTNNATVYYTSSFCKHESTHEERTEPTCDKAGSVKVICDACGYVVSSTSIAKLGHDYLVTTVEPTCQAKGYDLYECSRCGDSYKKNYTDKADHEYSVTTIAPTCSQNGWDLHECINCGDFYTDNVTAMVDHIDENSDNACDFCGKEMQPAEPPVCSCEQFVDVSENDWFHDAVVFTVDNKLMNGVSANEFAPNGNVTRAMLVTILYRNEGEPSVEGLGNPFADVPENQWYTNAIIWAADSGIVNGMTATTYAPDASITREQIATILYRYAKSIGLDVTFVGSDILGRFSDSLEISEYAIDPIQWAVSIGLINGIDGKLAPTATATRAQLATMLMRLIDWCAV